MRGLIILLLTSVSYIAGYMVDKSYPYTLITSCVIMLIVGIITGMESNRL